MQWLILFTLCIATFSANSKAQEPPLEQLTNMKIAAYQLSSAFSAYVLFTGSPKFDRKLNDAIDMTLPLLKNAQVRYPNITKQWQVSLDFIDNNKALVFDDADHRLVVSLTSAQNILYQMIADEKQLIIQDSSQSSNTSPPLKEGLKTRVIFERVVAQYMANAASTSGFAHSDISIEENVGAFSSRIKTITNNDANLKRLNTKWSFAKNNMLKKPGQTSPFLTLHTAADIRKTLKRIYSSELISSSDF